MVSQSQFQLLTQRRFAPFFWTQFLGAANDNIFKFSFTLLVTFHAAEISTLPLSVLANAIAGLFILPFVLFSATSGQLADKYDKALIMRSVKWLELLIMAAATYGFIDKNVPVLLACTFMMGLHSTIFGPVKYAYLPQHLVREEIVGGNGLVEMGTFVAILLGTMLGGSLANLGEYSAYFAAAASLLVALVGLLTSHFIPRSPAITPDLAINWNPVSETWTNLRTAYQNRVVWLSMLGISWLWFFGAIYLTQFPAFAKEVLHGDASVVTLLLAVFSFGIGLGSLLCERLSGRKVEIGLVPFGSIGMTLFAVDLYFASQLVTHLVQPHTWSSFIQSWAHLRVLADVFLLAMFGGFYSVPLYALIQTRSEATHRARIIAANNILNALLMVLSAGLAVWLLNGIGLSMPQLFLVVGILNAGVAIYIYSLVPEFLIRFLAWLLIHSLYRLRVEGAEKIPAKGAAILICNHVSFVDAVVLMAVSPRPIRFIMDHQIFKIPLLSWMFKHSGAIPIASAKVNPELMEKAFARASKVLRDGELLCIFPEGRITDTGELYPFRPGITRLLSNDAVPVTPMALSGLWGSFFSRKGGKAFAWKNFHGIFLPLVVRVGEPVPPEQATPDALQEKVQALRGEVR
ncbi:MFS transporter [Parvibium lacunae]|uniref:MFS transporter n=1 Tax=Parvibium lacunae TaxID=1888893 RepID=A0A368L571_9BURK|nr:MFS transporter [Parvibium lacunae]RCS58665.1 MFS transporter [Parvibium lacunae]